MKKKTPKKEAADITENETFLLDEVLRKQEEGFKHTKQDEELTTQDPIDQVKFPEALLDEVVKTTKIEYPDQE